MGSHALAAKYPRVPDALRARLVGQDYDLPAFAPDSDGVFKGYRVAMLSTHGPELPEFDVPVTYLRAGGATVDVITQDWLFDWQPEAPGTIVLAQWLAANVCAEADKKVSDARPEDYDAVITIGGAWNPIMLRTDDAILRFLQSACRRRLLIASICHGPQVLISARVFPQGTRATGVSDIRADMENAGFTIVSDARVVYDEQQRLITSPDPSALKEFCEEIGKRLVEARPHGASAPADARVSETQSR